MLTPQYEKNTYSTEEQKIGTWIDGKTLYRKTIDCGTIPNKTTLDISTGISNVNVVKYEGVVYRSDGVTYPLPLVHTLKNYDIKVNTINFGETIQIVTSVSDYNVMHLKAYITLYYTKITN